jgi:hypothetical protein
VTDRFWVSKPRGMHQRILFTFGTLAILLAACTVTTTSNNPGSPGGASSAQISSCKQSCDKMKFFGCNSADQQAACYADCDQATPAQIQVFTGCADNSVCDPACRTNIAPKPAGGGTATGTGASPSSCGTACDKLVSCSLIHVGDKAACDTECQKSAYQYQIDCVNNTACGNIQAACGNPTGGSSGGGSTSGGTTSGGTTSGGVDAGSDQFDIQVCQSACDTLNFFTCFSASDHAACRDLCTTAASAKRSTFSSCVNGSGSDCAKGGACYATFQN